MLFARVQLYNDLLEQHHQKFNCPLLYCLVWLLLLFFNGCNRTALGSCWPTATIFAFRRLCTTLHKQRQKVRGPFDSPNWLEALTFLHSQSSEFIHEVPKHSPIRALPRIRPAQLQLASCGLVSLKPSPSA